MNVKLGCRMPGHARNNVHQGRRVDGRPVPKIIDFGIAKATQQELTEKTVFTQFQHPPCTQVKMLETESEANLLIYRLGQNGSEGIELETGGCF